MKEITITLPVPDRDISPNARFISRGGMFAKAAKTKGARVHAKIATRNAIIDELERLEIFEIISPIGYSLAHFFDPRKMRDEDNADAACKAYLDGICDFFEMNDRNFTRQKLTTREKDKKNPRVEITIYFEDVT